MPLINCEISLLLTLRDVYVNPNANKDSKFALLMESCICQLFLLSAKEKTKLSKYSIAGCKGRFHYNKFLLKVTTQATPRAIQQKNSTRNPEKAGNTAIFSS